MSIWIWFSTWKNLAAVLGERALLIPGGVKTKARVYFTSSIFTTFS